MNVDISTTLGGIKLCSPLILGSFDALVDSSVLARCFEDCPTSLGAVVTKSTSIDPRKGYPEPKVAPFGSGLLVASGNPNPGIDMMTSEVRNFRERYPDAILIGSIVSDADHPERGLEEQYGFLALEYARAGVSGIELNLSCPHLDPHDPEHTIVPAQDPGTVHRLVSTVRSMLSTAGYPMCLVIPKLTGWNCHLAEVALSAQSAGADAITVSNLFPGTGYRTGLGDAATGAGSIGDPLVAHGKGGYTGKAMHSAVLLMIASLRKHIRIPIIGTGGCATDLDSLVQTFMAGATAVAAVTPFYFKSKSGPELAETANSLIDNLLRYLEHHRLDSPQQLYEIAGGRQLRDSVLMGS
jgi:dihydroorotate dehydrogenase (NAD+) catalytic subunit